MFTMLGYQKALSESPSLYWVKYLFKNYKIKINLKIKLYLGLNYGIYSN
jgi:hypothetical protein